MKYFSFSLLFVCLLTFQLQYGLTQGAQDQLNESDELFGDEQGEYNYTTYTTSSPYGFDFGEMNETEFVSALETKFNFTIHNLTEFEGENGDLNQTEIEIYANISESDFEEFVGEYIVDQMLASSDYGEIEIDELFIEALELDYNFTINNITEFQNEDEYNITAILDYYNITEFQYKEFRLGYIIAMSYSGESQDYEFNWEISESYNPLDSMQSESDWNKYSALLSGFKSNQYSNWLAEFQTGYAQQSQVRTVNSYQSDDPQKATFYQWQGYNSSYVFSFEELKYQSLGGMNEAVDSYSKGIFTLDEYAQSMSWQYYQINWTDQATLYNYQQQVNNDSSSVGNSTQAEAINSYLKSQCWIYPQGKDFVSAANYIQNIDITYDSTYGTVTYNLTVDQNVDDYNFEWSIVGIDQSYEQQVPCWLQAYTSALDYDAYSATQDYMVQQEYQQESWDFDSESENSENENENSGEASNENSGNSTESTNYENYNSSEYSYSSEYNYSEYNYSEYNYSEYNYSEYYTSGSGSEFSAASLFAQFEALGIPLSSEDKAQIETDIQTGNFEDLETFMESVNYTMVSSNTEVGSETFEWNYGSEMNEQQLEAFQSAYGFNINDLNEVPEANFENYDEYESVFGDQGKTSSYIKLTSDNIETGVLYQFQVVATEKTTGKKATGFDVLYSDEVAQVYHLFQDLPDVLLDSIKNNGFNPDTAFYVNGTKTGSLGDTFTIYYDIKDFQVNLTDLTITIQDNDVSFMADDWQFNVNFEQSLDTNRGHVTFNSGDYSFYGPQQLRAVLSGVYNGSTYLLLDWLFVLGDQWVNPSSYWEYSDSQFENADDALLSKMAGSFDLTNVNSTIAAALFDPCGLGDKCSGHGTCKWDDQGNNWCECNDNWGGLACFYNSTTLNKTQNVLSGYIGAISVKTGNFSENLTLMHETLTNVGGVLNNPALTATQTLAITDILVQGSSNAQNASVNLQILSSVSKATYIVNGPTGQNVSVQSQVDTLNVIEKVSGQFARVSAGNTTTYNTSAFAITVVPFSTSTGGAFNSSSGVKVNNVSTSISISVPAGAISSDCAALQSVAFDDSLTNSIQGSAVNIAPYFSVSAVDKNGNKIAVAGLGDDQQIHLELSLTQKNVTDVTAYQCVYIQDGSTDHGTDGCELYGFVNGKAQIRTKHLTKFTVQQTPTSSSSSSGYMISVFSIFALITLCLF